MSEQTENIFSQVDQQLANNQNATVLVERADGAISTAQIQGMEVGATPAFMGKIPESGPKGMDLEFVSNELLTDKYQTHLAEKLAGSAALSGAEVSNQYDDLWSTDEVDEQAAVKAAEVRQPVKPLSDSDINAIQTRQQMDINRADRQNRENAGLPPRTYDLR